MSNNQGEWFNISEIEVLKITDTSVTTGNNNYAENIQVNGVDIPNFEGAEGGDTMTVYTTKVPYATKDEDIEITVDSFDENGYYQVINGKIDQEPYKVITVSENLQVIKTYNILITHDKAPLKEVNVDLEDDYRMNVGDSIELAIKGTDEAGNTITDASGYVTYTIDNITGFAEINGRNLTAITSGYVEVNASIEYNGKTYNAPSKRIAIEKSSVDVTEVSVDVSQIEINSGEQLTLPQTVTVRLSNGFAVERNVSWNTVPERYLTRPGTFIVYGYVNGSSLMAKCEVTVVASGEVSRHVTFHTPKGVAPALPDQIVYGYDSNNNPIYKDVTWDTSMSDFDQEVGSKTTVKATFVGMSSAPLEFEVEIVDGVASPDYAMAVNGITKAPQPLVSHSAEGSLATFVNSNGTWTSVKEDEAPYVGFVFGEQGGAIQKSLKETVDTYKIGFTSETLPSDVKIQYYTGEIDDSLLPDSTTAYLNVESDAFDYEDLKNEANWKDATITTKEIGPETTVTFNPVQTYAVRAIFTKKNADDVYTSNDLVITGKTYYAKSDLPTFTSLGIKDDGKDVDIHYSEDKDEYVIDTADAFKLTINPVLAENSSGNYYILGDLGDSHIKIFAVSEDGSKTRVIDLRINDSSNIYKDIVSIDPLADITVDSVKDGEALNLPKTVKVNYQDGSSDEVDVQFDTSSFAGKKGTYTFKGTLDLPLEVRNDLYLSASITVHVREDYQEPVVPPETTTHTITIDDESVIVSKTEASEGETIFLTLDENSGQTMASVTGVDDITDYGNGTFSFVMPDKDVSLNVTLKDIHSLDGGDIAAITLGVILGVVLIGGATLFIFKKVKK